MKGKLNRKTVEKVGQERAVEPVEKSNDTGKIENERSSDTLVYLEDHRKRKVDETIDTPNKYLSRYHYDSKNLDKCLELCPHCRKPNTYTYRKVVVDSALNYLEEKEEQRGRHVHRSLLLGVTTGLLLVSAGVYYMLFHVLSG
jgi:hypothetical protein